MLGLFLKSPRKRAAFALAFGGLLLAGVVVLLAQA